MPKKSATVRAGTQRNKLKVQKNFELVRPKTTEASREQPAITEVPGTVPIGITTSTREKYTTSKKQAISLELEQQEENKNTIPKGSAAARMAAHRRATQKAQQRNIASLITSEHFTYVQRDLITIAILASIMFIAIIVLYFTIGRA